MRDRRMHVVVLAAMLTMGCGSAGRAIFAVAVVTAHVVQAAAEACAQEDVDCSGPAPTSSRIEVRHTHDPYAAAVDW